MMNHDIHDSGGISKNLDGVVARLSAREHETIVLFVLETRSLRDVARELDMTQLEAALQITVALTQAVGRFRDLGIRISPSELINVVETGQAGDIPSRLVERILANCHEIVSSEPNQSVRFQTPAE